MTPSPTSHHRSSRWRGQRRRSGSQPAATARLRALHTLRPPSPAVRRPGAGSNVPGRSAFPAERFNDSGPCNEHRHRSASSMSQSSSFIVTVIIIPPAFAVAVVFAVVPVRWIPAPSSPSFLAAALLGLVLPPLPAPELLPGPHLFCRPRLLVSLALPLTGAEIRELQARRIELQRQLGEARQRLRESQHAQPGRGGSHTLALQPPGQGPAGGAGPGLGETTGHAGEQGKVPGVARPRPFAAIAQHR